MILDVGCGSTAHGSVNIDAFPKDRNQCGQEYNPKHIQNFVLADAHYLPFHDQTFDMVVCSHVLEHLHNPLQTLKEMRRVCKHKVILRVPSHFNLDESKAHIFSWDPLTLKNLLLLVFRKVNVEYTDRVSSGHGRLSKYMPFIIVVAGRLGFHTELYAHCQK